MYFGRTVRSICITLLIFVLTPVQANEVSLQYKGIKLNARLGLAEGKKLGDGVILITHGGLAHFGMSTIANFRALLNEAGYNTLAINLSLGLDNRDGMYDCKITHRHKHHDAVDEIDAWVGWLKKRGVSHITLMGHSRGGGQTALYATERDNRLVKSVILLAPITSENGGIGYAQRYGKSLKPILGKSQELIRQGKGETVVNNANMLFCRDRPVTAASFVSYYGPDPRLDTPTLLPKISNPTLILVAGEDEIVRNLDKKVKPHIKIGKTELKVIETADHFFSDLYGDVAVEAIVQFLKKTY